MSRDDLAGRFAVCPNREACDRLLVRVVQSVGNLPDKPSVERWALVRRALDEHAAALTVLADQQRQSDLGRGLDTPRTT